MPGTLIAYQGHRCQSVTYNNARGYGPSVSEVVMLVQSFPGGFNFDLPPQGRIADLANMQVPDLSPIRSGRVVVPDIRRDLKWAGTLVMAEAQDETWQVIAHPLFVLRVDLAKASEAVPEARPLTQFVRVQLGDIRALYASRGFLRRWSYNRVRADGSVSPDSAGAGGEPLPRSAIAAEVVASLPGAPELSERPAEWADDKRPAEFPPYCQAVVALAELAREGSLVEPCLRLDGSVALHKQGDGRLGWAPNGAGRNVRDLPQGLRLWRADGSPGHSVEPTYRDEFVIVRGGLKVQTYQLDNAEPVLYARGNVRVLDDELVGELTGGQWTLETLRGWVMRSRGKQERAGISQEAQRLFREQAFRLWRLPGVEVLAPVTEQAEGGGLIETDDKVAVPGPNAHLLAGPGMQPRAETTAGKRWPVTVEAFTIKGGRRKDFSFDLAAQEEGQALRRIRSIQQKIAATLLQQGAGDIGRPGQASWWESWAAFKDELPFIGGGLDGRIPPELLAVDGPLGWADLAKKEDVAQLLERIAAVDSGLAREYEAELRRLYSARDAQNKTTELELFDLAKKLRDVQRRIASEDLGGEIQGEGFLGTIERAREFGGNLAEVANEELRRIREELGKIGKEAKARQAGTSERDLAAEYEAAGTRSIFRNMPRSEVPATVFSAALGIVKTAEIVGHLEEDGVPDRSSTRLKLMPVRITFGAHVRPRVDGGAAGSTTTREQVEHADAESWFARAFRRGDGGEPIMISLADVPPGEGRVVVKDWAELIPLQRADLEPTAAEKAFLAAKLATPTSLGLVAGEKAGNTAQLEAAAKEVAAERFSAPAKIESGTYVMARPWPINTDGLVSRVTIRSRDTPAPGTGFRTFVTVGKLAEAPRIGTTRERAAPPVPRGERDATVREGLE